jgi:hypothetical protein
MLSGIHAGSVSGDLLVLAGAAVYSVQIVLMERFAPRFDALAFTRRDGRGIRRPGPPCPATPSPATGSVHSAGPAAL